MKYTDLIEKVLNLFDKLLDLDEKLMAVDYISYRVKKDVQEAREKLTSREFQP